MIPEVYLHAFYHCWIWTNVLLGVSTVFKIGYILRDWMER